MNLRQLETFRAVITAGTTNGAATLLGVSQPAVSRMIAHTEQSLGLRLFERHKGRLIPTEEAVQLHREIEPLFLAVEAAQSRIYDIRDGKVGSIQIVATPTLANTVMPRVLSELAQTTPEIRVSLDVRRWEQIAAQIEANTADLGLALRARDRPTLVNKALHTGRFVCIMPNGHPLSKRDNVYAQDMLDHPFIRLNRSSPLGEPSASNLGDDDSLLKTAVETPYCLFPRKTEPGFPSRSEPHLGYVSWLMLAPRHSLDPSFFGPQRLNWPWSGSCRFRSPRCGSGGSGGRAVRWSFWRPRRRWPIR